MVPMNRKPNSSHHGVVKQVNSSPALKPMLFRKCNDINMPAKKSNEWAKVELKGCDKELCVQSVLKADMYCNAVYLYDEELAIRRDKEVEQQRPQRMELVERFKTFEAMKRNEEQQLDEALKENKQFSARIHELETYKQKVETAHAAKILKLEAENRELKKSNRELEANALKNRELVASHAAKVRGLEINASKNRELVASHAAKVRELEINASKNRELVASHAAKVREMEINASKKCELVASQAAKVQELEVNASKNRELVASHAAQVHKLETQILELKKLNRELVSLKRELETSHEAKVNQVKTANRNLAALKRELEALYATKIQELETSKLQLERKVEVLNEIVHQRDNVISAMSQQIDALRLVKAEQETKHFRLSCCH